MRAGCCEDGDEFCGFSKWIHCVSVLSTTEVYILVEFDDASLADRFRGQRNGLIFKDRNIFL